MAGMTLSWVWDASGIWVRTSGSCKMLVKYEVRFLSSKPKGPGEKRASRNHPEISSQKVADFECRFPHDSYGRDRHHLGLFYEKDFGAISGGPFLSRPLLFIADFPVL